MQPQKKPGKLFQRNIFGFFPTKVFSRVEREGQKIGLSSFCDTKWVNFALLIFQHLQKTDFWSPISVMNNSIGSRTTAAMVAHVARSGRSRIDATNVYGQGFFTDQQRIRWLTLLKLDSNYYMKICAIKNIWFCKIFHPLSIFYSFELSKVDSCFAAAIINHLWLQLMSLMIFNLLKYHKKVFLKQGIKGIMLML